MLLRGLGFVIVLGFWRVPLQEGPSRSELPIQAPQGWESRTQGVTLLLSPKDLPAGKTYTVLVPGLPRPAGTVRGLLDLAKATLGQVGEFKSANEPVGSKTDAGWEFEVVIGTLTKSGVDLTAQAMGFKKGEKEGILLIIADSLGTLQKYSDPFTTMIRSMDSARPAPAPAAAPAAAGAVDLVYTVPDGWKQDPQVGTVWLSWTNAANKNPFDPVRVYRLAIFPSQPLQGGLRPAFGALWDALVQPTFTTSIVPLPMIRRLKSGLLCAFDLEEKAKAKDGQILQAGLYLLAQGNRAVPMVGVFSSPGRDLDASLLSLMESARIPGASDDRIVPFSAAELAGEWKESSMSAAVFVTASGQVAGDASIAIASGVTLGSDGTFQWHFVGTGRGQSIVENDQGPWRIDDTALILEGKARNRHYLIYGVGKDPRAGSFLVTSLSDSSEVPLGLGFPRNANAEKWYKRKE